MNDPLFKAHKLNARGLTANARVSELFNQLLFKLNEVWVEEKHLNPKTIIEDALFYSPGKTREAALCRTKLEEACFYAKKALAQNGNNQE